MQLQLPLGTHSTHRNTRMFTHIYAVMAVTTIDRSVRRLLGLFMALTCADLSLLLLPPIVATIVFAFVFVYIFALVFVAVIHLDLRASEMASCLSLILQLVDRIAGPLCAANLHAYVLMYKHKYIFTSDYAFTCIWQLPPPLLLPLTSWWVRLGLVWPSHGICSRKRHMCRHCDYLLLFLLCVSAPFFVVAAYDSRRCLHFLRCSAYFLRFIVFAWVCVCFVRLFFSLNLAAGFGRFSASFSHKMSVLP